MTEPKKNVKFEELLKRGYVTLDDIRSADARFNSYQWRELVPILSNEVLVFMIEHCLNNCAHRHPVPITYDDAAIVQYLPELLRRFREIYPCDAHKDCRDHLEIGVACRRDRAVVLHPVAVAVSCS